MNATEAKTIKSMPMFMLVFLSSATMLSVFNIIAPQLVRDFHSTSATVSLLSMIGTLSMGIASVVYATISDYISIRKLMLIGIALLNLGAALSLIFANLSFYLLLVSSALMILGGTCGSGLMIITVTRYLSKQYHAKYYGYVTACVSLSQALGILLGGFAATYLNWKLVYLIPFVSLIAIPTIKKYVPNDSNTANNHLDVLGLSLLTIFTILISLYFDFSKCWLLLAALASLAIFFLYISKASNPFITIEFFKNKDFMSVIVLVIFMFGLQSAFNFLFPFIVQGVYHAPLSRASLLLFPSCVFGAIVGSFSGKIVNKLGVNKTLISTVCLGIIFSVLTAWSVDKGLLPLSAFTCLFVAVFALFYAPLMQWTTSTLQPDQIGTGIGFFNLITGIGPSLMVVIVGKLLTLSQLQAPLLKLVKTGDLYSNILLLFTLIFILSLLIILVEKKSIRKAEL